MLREARMRGSPRIVDGFRMRGRDVTRLESFSDAVFGFALTSADPNDAWFSRLRGLFRNPGHDLE